MNQKFKNIVESQIKKFTSKKISFINLIKKRSFIPSYKHHCVATIVNSMRKIFSLKKLHFNKNISTIYRFSFIVYDYQSYRILIVKGLVNKTRSEFNKREKFKIYDLVLYKPVNILYPDSHFIVLYIFIVGFYCFFHCYSTQNIV